MASLNKVQLIGNLGKDPDVRHLPDGTPTATISLATSESWKDKKTGKKAEATEWHRAVFYRGLAEVVNDHLVKGATVYIEGKLKTRKFTDKEGIERYVTEIRANELVMLGGKRKDGAPENGGSTSFKDSADDGQDDDDIPF